jgi:hypothetical protein
MSAIPYHYQLFTIDYIVKILIYKDIINYKTHNPNKECRCTLFNILHSAKLNHARTTALQDVAVKDDNTDTDCFKEDC